MAPRRLPLAARVAHQLQARSLLFLDLLLDGAMLKLRLGERVLLLIDQLRDDARLQPPARPAPVFAIRVPPPSPEAWPGMWICPARTPRSARPICCICCAAYCWRCARGLNLRLRLHQRVFQALASLRNGFQGFLLRRQVILRVDRSPPRSSRRKLRIVELSLRLALRQHMGVIFLQAVSQAQLREARGVFLDTCAPSPPES